MAKPFSLEQLTHRVESLVKGQNLVASVSALLAVSNAVLTSIINTHPNIVRMSILAMRNTCDKLEKLLPETPKSET